MVGLLPGHSKPVTSFRMATSVRHLPSTQAWKTRGGPGGAEASFVDQMVVIEIAITRW